MKIQSYRDLTVWQKAMELVVGCYKFVSNLPKNETYGLISQTQRAAVSIPANIAEGHGRDHLGDYLRHLSIANGSLMELETHIERLIFERRRLVERRWTHRGLLGAQDVLSAVAQSGFVSPFENTRRERIAI